MKAIILSESAKDPLLELCEVEQPVPKRGQLLIRVAAAGINRAELNAPPRSGHAMHPQGIPGGELSGIVEAVGEGSETRFRPGDRIMALASGSYAQFACVDDRLAISVPDGIDLVTAASLPAWFMTAHNAVLTEGGLMRGETVLIQGATSGIGIAAAKLARHFGAARIIGIARSADKLKRLEGGVIDKGFVATDRWGPAVNELTGGNGVDLIIDMVGAGAVGDNLSCAAVRGRIVAVGRLGGTEDRLDLNMLSMKRIRLIGVSFRTRSISERADVAGAFARDVLPAIVAGQITPMIDRTFPLSEARQAQDHVRSNKHLGKTLLEIR